MAYDQAKAVQIYALCCPDTGRVRYVGKANDAGKRLASHLRDAKRRNTPVYSWIRSLQSKGSAPTMRVLASTWDWPETERVIIAQFRGEGELLNLADGGDEPKCPKSVQVENGKKLRELMDNPVVYAARSLLRDGGQRAHYMRKVGRTEAADKMQAAMARLRSLGLEEVGLRMLMRPNMHHHFPASCQDELRELSRV